MKTIPLLVSLFFINILLYEASTSQPHRSHQDLDWNAPRRWVHIDHVDPQKVQLFEGARKWWLDTLRRAGSMLGDGRPLFWSSRSESACTYFTFYPFNNWSELDERKEMIDQTKSIVGAPAVKKYDTGDAALIPPHCSQIWRRIHTSDIVWSGTDSLTERNARAGQIEVRQIDWWHWDEFDSLWIVFSKILKEEQYPLACRVFTNDYGDNQGEYFLFWLADESSHFQNAPPVGSILEKNLVSKAANDLMDKLNKYFPLQASYTVERRPDLSNLPMKE